MDIREIPIGHYDRVAHCRDAESGLNAFIAIHDTTLGPALGGLRMLPYESEDEALSDVLRLAEAMTYKSAVAETGLGGGKAVIVGDPATKTDGLLRAAGRFVDAMDGRYITAADMNMGLADLQILARETRWVAGMPRETGSSGEPSPSTAQGCLAGMKTCLCEAFGDPSLKGRAVAIQGVGHVGGRLAALCIGEGAEVSVSDVDLGKARGFARDNGARFVEDPAAHLLVECDLLAPCARGGILNRETVPELRCAIVAGAANNQVEDESCVEGLRERGILYAPDYVINAGGIVNIGCEFLPGGYDGAESRRRVARIGGVLAGVFRIAREERISTVAAARRLAEERLAEGRKENRTLGTRGEAL